MGSNIRLLVFMVDLKSKFLFLAASLLTRDWKTTPSYKMLCSSAASFCILNTSAPQLEQSFNLYTAKFALYYFSEIQEDKRGLAHVTYISHGTNGIFILHTTAYAWFGSNQSRWRVYNFKKMQNQGRDKKSKTQSNYILVMEYCYYICHNKIFFKNVVKFPGVMTALSTSW